MLVWRIKTPLIRSKKELRGFGLAIKQRKRWGRQNKKNYKPSSKKVSTKDKTGNIVVYPIPWDYSDEEIKKFIEQNTYELHKYNYVIVAENTILILYLNLNELMKISYESVRRLELVARDT